MRSNEIGLIFVVLLAVCGFLWWFVTSLNEYAEERNSFYKNRLDSFMGSCAADWPEYECKVKYRQAYP